MDTNDRKLANALQDLATGWKEALDLLTLAVAEAKAVNDRLIAQPKTLCQMCQKNVRTIHLTAASDGNVAKLSLCESCHTALQDFFKSN